MPWGINQKPPWATGQTSTTDDLAQQVSNSARNNQGPTSQGYYNPMYNMGQGNAPTMKDLASLYYKSVGAGVVGDNPHPYHAANVYRDAMNVEGNIADVVGDEFKVKSPEDVRAMLKANIQAAPGGRQAVADALISNIGDFNAKKVTNAADKSIIAKTGNKGAASAADLVGNGGASEDPLIASQWMQHYVDPYIQQQQAMMNFQADMFDQVASSIIPTMDPNKAEIMKAYLPLISAAYHQRANSFATDFLTGTGRNSLFDQLLKQQRRQASAENFLAKQNGGGTGDFGSLLSGITNG